VPSERQQRLSRVNQVAIEIWPAVMLVGLAENATVGGATLPPEFPPTEPPPAGYALFDPGKRRRHSPLRSQRDIRRCGKKLVLIKDPADPSSNPEKAPKTACDARRRSGWRRRQTKKTAIIPLSTSQSPISPHSIVLIAVPRV